MIGIASRGKHTADEQGLPGRHGRSRRRDRRSDDPRRRLRVVRQPRELHPRARAQEGHRADDRVEQLRDDRSRPRRLARAGPGQEDGRLLYVGENKVFEQLFPIRQAWRSSSVRKARSPNACAPAVPGSKGSTRRPVTARRSPTASRPASSAASPACSSTRSRGEFAIVKAWKGDKWGNVVFRTTSRNFNPLRAQAGKDHDRRGRTARRGRRARARSVSHLPSIYVQRIFQGSNYAKPIEQRTTRKRGAA